MVVPSLPALLAYFAWQMLGNLAPVAGTFLFNKFGQECVLVWAPRGVVLDKWRINHKTPSIKALLIRATFYTFGNPLPIPTELLNSYSQFFIFFRRPRPFEPFDQLRVKSLIPSIETLYVATPNYTLCNLLPVFWAVFFNSFCKHYILFLGPVTLDQIWVQNIMPAVSTLYISPSRHTRGDFFPLFGTIELNSLYQLLILLFSPSSFAIFLDILVRT